MKKRLSILLIALFTLSSCATIEFTADGKEVVGSERVFYVVGGLAPITNNKFKTGQTLETKSDIIDVLISGFTGSIIYTRTVVKK